MNIVVYARVSDPKIQDAEDKVSIDQQLADQRSLCERNGWQVVGEFVDRESYRATQNPKRGKVINPSGERADRPQFLAMLEVIKTGKADIVLCWRDDRLVRHPRVAVALEDALDIGDVHRNGKPKIEVRDATNAMIDRFTLSIKATIWREENKRRAERIRMGKEASLRMGRWPGEFRRWGYKSVKVPGERGRTIVEDPETAPIVRKIYEMYDSGIGVPEIRKHLMAIEAPQIYTSRVLHEWSKPLICRILRSEEYLGVATWTFKDGTVIKVDIPQIIEPELWQRVQQRMDRNRRLSRRNAKGVYLLQGLGQCGECGHSLSAARDKFYKGGHAYRCHTASAHPHEPHPHPVTHNGAKLDWAVWRHIVDFAIKRPDLVRKQVRARQAELQAQGDSVHGEMAHARNKLAEVDQQRAFYQRQAARGKMTEQEFDTRMAETGEARRYWESELARLRELRDDAERVRAGLDYATELLAGLQDRLEEIDIPPKDLKALPKEQQRAILKERQVIVRALCDRVLVYASRRIVIEGLLDGSEAAQFELRGS
jgi:DNA invertase Pin-like site-specific DNA recombinase